MKTRLIVIFLLVALALFAICSARQKSATFDELPHLGHGYYYLRTMECNISTPLVNIIANIPLLFLDLEFPWIDIDRNDIELWGYTFGHQLLYESNQDADKILFIARLSIILISLLGGLVVFKWTSKLYGQKAGILALFLYVFSPNILAHCRLVTHDLAVSCFILLALYQFWIFKESPTFKNLLFAGLGLGLALSSKPTAFLILPTYIVYGLLYNRTVLRTVPISAGRHRLLPSLALIFLIGFFVLGLSSGFSNIGDYFKGFSSLSEQTAGRPSFLMGETGRGWYHYFAVAFLIKTPIPTLILLLLTLLFFKGIKSKQAADELLLILPILTIFGVASYSRFNLGLRHILPIYPLLFVFIGKAANLKFRGSSPVILILCGWYLFSSLSIYPHYLAYFNEFVGGPENGYKCLVDSNLDWGQDLKGLKRWMEKEGVNEIILGYFGTASRDYYGIKHQFLPSLGSGTYRPYVLPLDINREILAISATTLQGVYSSGQKDEYGWLRSCKPLAKIGYSIFVYDITNDPKAHKRLGEIYLDRHLLKEAIREHRKVVKINPKDPLAHKELAKTYALAGLYPQAIEECQEVLRLDPNIYQAYGIMGLIYQDIDRKDKARDCFKKVLKLNPKDSLAQEMIRKLDDKE